MSNSLLLPHRYKNPGWVIFGLAFILGVILSLDGFDPAGIKAPVFAFFNDEIFGKEAYFSFITTDITNTVVGLMFIIGAMMVGFSREKIEDEFISNLRLSSLLWAVWVSYALLFLAFIFIYGGAFFTVMVYNMFTVLIIFIFRFNYLLYKNSKPADEK